MSNDQRGAAESGASARPVAEGEIPFAPHQNPTAEQELPASSVSAASVSPTSSGRLGSEASAAQQPAPAAGPSAVEEVNRLLNVPTVAIHHAEELDRLRAENEKLQASARRLEALERAIRDLSVLGVWSDMVAAIAIIRGRAELEKEPRT